MYQINDHVVYGSHGVCKITGEEDRVIDRKVISYFALEPVGQPGAKFFVPSKNPAALAKLRPLMDRRELLALLGSSQVRTSCWISDEARRKQRYRELISSGDCTALVSMVYSLHLHKKELFDSGKRMHQCDENFLHDATKLLTTEFSMVLDIPCDEVPQYIHSLCE